MSELRSSSSGAGRPGNLSKPLAASIIAGLAVFAGLAVYADVTEVGQSFAGFKWPYVPLILGLTLLNYFLRFCKWHYYLDVLGIELRRADSLRVFLAGLTMSVTPAKLGEVFKSYLLKRLNGTEVSRSAPIVLVERMTDVLGLVTLAAMSFSAFRYGLHVMVVTLALLLLLVAVVRVRSLAHRLLEVTARAPLLGRLSTSLSIAYESAHTLFGLKTLMVGVVLGVISWGFECVALYFVLQGLGVDASLLLATFVFSFSSLAGAVSMIPGGLAVAEGSLAGLLITAGVGKGIAATATIMIRFCTLWFGMALGAASLLASRRLYMGSRKVA